MSTTKTYDPVHGSSYTFEPQGENMICDAWLEPGGALPPHSHPRQEERWSVVEGSAKFQLGARKWMITPEDGAILVRPGVKHSLANVSDSEVHLRCEVVPALGIQDFLEDSAAAAREGLFMKGGIPKSLRGAKWAANFLKKHQDDVVMDFPPKFAQKAMIAIFVR